MNKDVPGKEDTIGHSPSPSKRPTRALLLGRHFWPHGSLDSAGYLIDLASGLSAAGIHVTVATPKHAASWAEEFTFREFQVCRPLRMFKTGWTARADRSPSRYIKHLREWIESDPTACDIIISCGGREEAIAAVGAARPLNVPVAVRLMGDGQESDLHYYGTNRGAARCQTFVAQADAVIVGSATMHREWLAAGGSPDKTHRIAAGIGPTIESNAATKKLLRRALSQINGDLFVPDACSVILSVERMRKDSGLMTLVESAYGLSQTVDGLQYWLIGDGPRRDAIYTRMRSDGLRQVTSMPGSYGRLDDLFASADLMVHAGDEGFQHQIPSAIAAGIPLILADTAVARDFFDATKNSVAEQFIERRGKPTRKDNSADSLADQVWWFDPGRPKTLRFAIEQVVSNLDLSRERAAKLRQSFQRNQSSRQSIAAYIQLISQLQDASS